MHKFLFLTLFTFIFSQAEITNIQASQRTDGSKIVDITYDLLPDPVFQFFTITPSVSTDGGESYINMNYMSGDVGDLIEAGNDKTITWEFGSQFSSIYSDQMKIKILASSFALVDDNDDQELPFEMIYIDRFEYTSGENDEITTTGTEFEIMKYEVTDVEYVLFMMQGLEQENIGSNDNNQHRCSDGEMIDCVGQCVPQEFLGDGFCDGTDQLYGADLCCYNNDNGDCNEQGCQEVGCGDGICGGNETYDNCPEDCDDPPQEFESYVNEQGFYGYYVGDAINPAGTYQFINFSDSKISWNGQIFEVVEGHVNHPVTGVTWFGAWAFATYYGMQIPTNDEWEKAARGNTGNNYPFGDNISYQKANYNNSPLNWNVFGLGFINNTTPVGMYDGRILNVDCSAIEDPQYGNCVYDWTPYGAADCDAAWDEYGIDCATLEANYAWDCSGCACPGDEWNFDEAECLSLFPDETFITIDSPSAYGLYDMAGNVQEIVHNGNGSRYYAMGGHWNSSESNCQSWMTVERNAGTTDDYTGFRCIRRINRLDQDNNKYNKKQKIINQNKMIKQLKKITK